MRPHPPTLKEVLWGVPILVLVGIMGAIWTWQGMGTRQRGWGERPLEGLGVFGRVPDFSLIERSGRRIERSDLLGKVWIVNFIYTHCPDTCPLQSAQMAQLQADLMAEQEVRLVSITVDPERDTREVLARYAGRFGADPERWLFLTGEKEAISHLAQEGFHLSAVEVPPEKRATPEASHLHSSRFVLVDRQARIRGYYPSSDAEALQRLRQDVKTLLREG